MRMDDNDNEIEQHILEMTRDEKGQKRFLRKEKGLGTHLCNVAIREEQRLPVGV